MSRERHALIVAVIGGSSATPQQIAVAEDVGQRLAQVGATLICGGRGGIMEAACRGAKLAGGLTVGILPGNTADEANPFVDIPIVTGIGEARNSIILRTAQVAIAVGGSYGTLSEIAFALRFGKPVIGLGTWQMMREGHPSPPIHYVETAKEAVELAITLAR